ncbi:MAG: hypothetical protein M3Q36_02060 [bacterium]|nr:hypothetical protein [bacterium]
MSEIFGMHFDDDLPHTPERINRRARLIQIAQEQTQQQQQQPAVLNRPVELLPRRSVEERVTETLLSHIGYRCTLEALAEIVEAQDDGRDFGEIMQEACKTVDIISHKDPWNHS